mmetsp:Transcript_3431/g.21489  ORF Transcript_3431/g.21489 Transcript_3431/m.21489 type:complete len:80 (+) Transcript_3431:421-660(+)
MLEHLVPTSWPPVRAIARQGLNARRTSHAFIGVSKIHHARQAAATRLFMDKLVVHPTGREYEVSIEFPLELVFKRKWHC